MTGILCWWLWGLLHLEVPLIYCLLFGALISPTDPIAVLGVLKTTRVSESLATKIAGESLFNDGVAVVVFLVIFQIAVSGGGMGPEKIAGLFAKEALGGLLFGMTIGWAAYAMLKSVDNYQVEILITLALTAGGYALAEKLHLSAPIAIVVAGLLIGNQGRLFAMSAKTRRHLDAFWELVDEILNAVLFVLIGLEVLVLTFTRQYLVAGAVVIPLVLIVRFVSVGLPVVCLKTIRSFSPHAVKLLTWCGLRGGISIALALSLPAGPHRDVIVSVTYAVVVFSILVQGLTIERVVQTFYPQQP